jgi:hypothetical protein
MANVRTQVWRSTLSGVFAGVSMKNGRLEGIEDYVVLPQASSLEAMLF